MSRKFSFRVKWNPAMVLHGPEPVEGSSYPSRQRLNTNDFKLVIETIQNNCRDINGRIVQGEIMPKSTTNF